MNKKKNKTMADILSDSTISELDKKILFEKWKFNQLPEFYRSQKENLEAVKIKIAKMIQEAEINKKDAAKGGETKN